MVPNPADRMSFLEESESSGARGPVAVTTKVAFMVEGAVCADRVAAALFLSRGQHDVRFLGLRGGAVQ
jgi:hypothetical protein